MVVNMYIYGELISYLELLTFLVQIAFITKKQHVNALKRVRTYQDEYGNLRKVTESCLDNADITIVF